MKKWSVLYTFINVGGNKNYFTSGSSDRDKKYATSDICQMVVWEVAVLHCLLTCFSYENEFLDRIIKENRRRLARKFNLSYHYVDDLIVFYYHRCIKFISDIYVEEITQSSFVAFY